MRCWPTFKRICVIQEVCFTCRCVWQDIPASDWRRATLSISMATPRPPKNDAPLPHATVVFVGLHQSGKSTAVGHIVVKLGALDKRALERVERETSNRPTSRFSWILDRHRLERERSISTDLKLCRVQLPPPPTAASTAVCRGPSESSLALTLVDTPGHTDYLKNAIAGITQADVAVLLVDSRPAMLESGAWADLNRELYLLASNLANHKALVVAVNHLDIAIEAGVVEQRYQQTVAAVFSRVLKCGPGGEARKGVTFVPVSGLAGDNLTEPSPRLTPWYSGGTLMDAVAAAVATTAATQSSRTAPARDMPLRIPLIGAFKVGGIGTVPAGRLAGGTLGRGATAQIAPAGAAAEVRSLESFHEPVTGAGVAGAGNWVGLAVKGVPVGRLWRGCVVSNAADRPARWAAEFTAKIQVLCDPTSKRDGRIRHMRRDLFCPIVHIHTAQAPCRLKCIKRLNTKGEVLEESAEWLLEGDIAVVVLVPLVPLVVETFKDYPHMGRFAMRATLRPDLPNRREIIVAVGLVEAVMHVSESEGDALPGLEAVGREQAPSALQGKRRAPGRWRRGQGVQAAGAMSPQSQLPADVLATAPQTIIDVIDVSGTNEETMGSGEGVSL